MDIARVVVDPTIRFIHTTLLSVVLKTHYCDVIMGAVASQINSFTIVYSTVYSDVDQRKHQGPTSPAFCAGYSPGTGQIPAQMASNAENVSIWWCHNGTSNSHTGHSDQPHSCCAVYHTTNNPVHYTPWPIATVKGSVNYRDSASS